MSDSENNGNVIGERRRPSITNGSAEDLSEYTDADESISAPTEILAEFLSAIMLKQYETALKYCKIILNYEPNNSTAREFYPLILEKIEIMKAEQNEQDEDNSDFSESAPSVDSNHSSTSGDESEPKTVDSDATSASYSSLEDEEADRDNSLSEFNDIANGNSTTNREMIISEITDDNMDIKDEKNGNEEMKRKVESTAGCRTFPPETVKGSRFPSKEINGSNLGLSEKLRRNIVPGDMLDERRSSAIRSFSFYSAGDSDFTSPLDEFRLVDDMNNTITSSDSEFTNDLTVDELRRKPQILFDTQK
ncbi:UNVERIFIED_CONTAM: hypothetical protein PYX00_008792 [Menopon gallinae]|uniref:Uncharacterized protein n=1 Tax=Menopon gallinae TaxID=328185 RepID=A0AAW2HPN9_9NEOP